MEENHEDLQRVPGAFSLHKNENYRLDLKPYLMERKLLRRLSEWIYRHGFAPLQAHYHWSKEDLYLSLESRVFTYSKAQLQKALDCWDEEGPAACMLMIRPLSDEEE